MTGFQLLKFTKVRQDILLRAYFRLPMCESAGTAAYLEKFGVVAYKRKCGWSLTEQGRSLLVKWRPELKDILVPKS